MVENGDALKLNKRFLVKSKNGQSFLRNSKITNKIPTIIVTIPNIENIPIFCSA